MLDQTKQNKSKRIGMIAYTEYHSDARVKRYCETLLNRNFIIDCYVLSEPNKEKVEKIKGLSIIHAPISQYRGQSYFGYIFSYFRFFCYGFKMISIRNRKTYSIVHVHNMPDFLVFISLLNKFSGAKIILDIHDTMPELYKVKFKSFVRNIIYYLLLLQEKISSSFADIIINVNNPHSKHMINNHGIDGTKTNVICNFPDKKYFNVNRFNNRKSNSNNIFKLIYHGTISDRFGLDIILDGIKQAIVICPNILLNIYGKGDGVDSLLKKINTLELSSNVIYHGQIDLEKIPEKIYFSDLGIVSYKINESTNLMFPLKLMENIAMLTPVLTVKNDAIDHYFNSGELEYYQAGNSDSFSAKLIEIVSQPNRLAEIRKKLKKINVRLNWDLEESKYLKIIDKLHSISSPL